MTTASTGDSNAGSDTDDETFAQAFDAFYSFNNQDDVDDFEDDEYVSYIFKNHVEE